jgi:hypothetical protein
MATSRFFFVRPDDAHNEAAKTDGTRPRRLLVPNVINAPIGVNSIHKNNEAKALFSDWKFADLLVQLTDNELSGHASLSES